MAEEMSAGAIDASTKRMLNPSRVPRTTGAGRRVKGVRSSRDELAYARKRGRRRAFDSRPPKAARSE